MGEVHELRPPLRSQRTDDGHIIWYDGETPQTSTFAVLGEPEMTEAQAWQVREETRAVVRQPKDR